MGLRLRDLRAAIFLILAGLCLSPWVNSATALLLGVFLALSIGNTFAETTKKLTHRFLSLAVIGLGAGMNLNTVAQVGIKGIGYTVITIAAAFVLGGVFGKLLHTEKNTSILVTIGTAICGGSAIAATAPVLRAKPHQVSVSLGIVFLLNAVALLFFPLIGRSLNMTETQFGLWSALAIHDTSSVVGATLQYGSHALEVGTTVKLARALWIVPVTLLIGAAVSRRNRDDVADQANPKKPWFILGFVVVAGVVTWVHSTRAIGHLVESGAKRLLVLTLFLIGTNLTRDTLKSVGFRPFIQGVALWFILASGSLFAITQNWIK